MAMSVAFFVYRGTGQEDEAHADPENENARDPKSHVCAVVVIHEEPKCYACDEAREGRDEKWIINFLKHS